MKEACSRWKTFFLRRGEVSKRRHKKRKITKACIKWRGLWYVSLLNWPICSYIHYCYTHPVYNQNYPVGIYLLKINNRKARTRCEICTKLTIKTPVRSHWRRCGVSIIKFEHMSHLVLVFLLLTLNM